MRLYRVLFFLLNIWFSNVLAAEISYPEIDRIRTDIFQKSAISFDVINADLRQDLEKKDYHVMGWKLISYSEYLSFQGRYIEAEEMLSQYASSPCNMDYEYWQVAQYMLNLYSFQYRKCIDYYMSPSIDKIEFQSSFLYPFVIFSHPPL